MSEQYSYVRFSWFPLEISELTKELGEFNVDIRKSPTSINDISPYSRFRDYLVVKSDTLTALLGPFRAILSQKKKMYFTKKDMRLREIVLREYPKTSSTFFPWGFSKEPMFEIELDVETK